MKHMKLLTVTSFILFCFCMQHARANSYVSLVDGSHLSEIEIVSTGMGFGLIHDGIPEPSKLKLQSVAVDALKDVFKEYPDITVQSGAELNDYMSSISPNVLHVGFILSSGEVPDDKSKGIPLSLTMFVRTHSTEGKTLGVVKNTLSYAFIASGSKEDYERSIGEAVKALSKSLPIYIFCARKGNADAAVCHEKHKPF